MTTYIFEYTRNKSPQRIVIERIFGIFGQKVIGRTRFVAVSRLRGVIAHT
jgi:hypothetical protein